MSAKIVEQYVEGENRIGVVEFSGRRRTVYLNLVPNARVGDYVRFHAGFATELVTAADAQVGDEQFGNSHEGADHDLETYQAYRLLGGLDAEQLRKVVSLAQEQRFEAGQTIFHSGEKSSFLHLIVSGDVVLQQVKQDRQIAIQTLHAGDAMGWSALTSMAQTHFQARALSPVCTIAFQGAQLREACDRDPPMGYVLMKRLLELLAERVDAMRQQLTDRTVAERDPQLGV
jgi:CRP/FNR family cyclic AMP-dependent transcriptional regulator